MLHCKNINKISELKNGFTPMWPKPDFISSSLKSFSFLKLCHVVSEVKVKGYSFAAKFKALTQNNHNNDCSPKCLIVDDTLLEKTEKSIEKVSRMWLWQRRQ